MDHPQQTEANRGRNAELSTGTAARQGKNAPGYCSHHGRAGGGYVWPEDEAQLVAEGRYGPGRTTSAPHSRGFSGS